MKSLLIAAGATVAYGLYWYISHLRHNIAEAKRSGLPYIVAPCSPIWLPWQITHKLFTPVIQLFPEAWWAAWLDPITPDFSYRTRHTSFARLGDAFIIVSPGMMYLMVANAEAITQITTRREHFPKYTDMYSVLDQFGENILTTEGSVWRMHRRITSPSFNERNAAFVFHESIRQAQGMVDTWKSGGGDDIDSLESDTMRLALNIIGYVGFGLRLLWPGETQPAGTDPKLIKYGSLEAPTGYTLSFVNAMAHLLENIFLLLLVPRWLLRLIPSEKTRLAADSHQDYKQYMSELLEEKIEEARKGEHAEGMDLMGQMARSSYSVKGSTASSTSLLTDAAVQGSSFLFLLAGHETTANAVHFTLIELATNPSAQRRLQREIDELLGATDPKDWDYESLVNPMMAGMLGACMNETLRKLPPVVEIPKRATPAQDQVLSIDGRKHVVPKGTVVILTAIAVHRNPRYWPARPSKVRAGHDDLDDYVPERWFRTSEQAGPADAAAAAAAEPGEDFGGYDGADTSASQFRPARGAYIPFSDGARSCLGRRIAQVEIIAALAVVFRSYSVELAVDEDDDAVEKMGRESKAAMYKTAQERSRRTIAGATSVVTLKLHGEHVKVRVVKRGEERFVNWVDDAR